MSAIREWYGLYNIMYNWIEENYGYKDLEDYWKYVADEVYSDLAESFKEKGLTYIRDYFKKIIEVDEGVVNFDLIEDKIVVDIIESPDYKWQKFFYNSKFLPGPNYFKSYDVIYGEVAKKAGFRYELLRYDPCGNLKFSFTK